MSAGVGRHEGANPADFYPTPPRAAVALRDFWLANFGCPDLVIDPCAGMGCLLRPWRGTSYTKGFEISGEILEAARDEAEELSVYKADGLEAVAGWNREDVYGELPEVLTVVNPPFSKADEWVAAVVESSRRHNVACAILLRSQWIDDGNTKGRGAYRYEQPATAILRLPWRIRFNGKGADSCTYAWHMWHPDPNSLRAPFWPVAQLDRTDAQKAASSCITPTFWAPFNSSETQDLEELGMFWERAAAVWRGD